MVTFDADLTDPPGIDTNDWMETVMNWLGYGVVAGLALVVLGLAQQTIAPLFANLLSFIPGVNPSQGGVPVRRVD